MTELRVCANPDCNESFTSDVHNKKYHSPACKRAAENVARRMMVRDFVDATAGLYDQEDEYDDEAIELLSDPNTGSDARLAFLKRENSRLFNLVEKHKNYQREALDAVFNAVTENIKRVTVAPPAKRDTIRKDKFSLVANPCLADWQLGKVTPSYSSESCEERVERFADKTIERIELHRNEAPIDTAHVYFLGDIVEGEQIFPTQPWLIDSSLYQQVALDGPRIAGNYLRRLLEVVENVNVVGVIGNHGRLSKFNNPETNMDRILYKILDLMFAYEPRITFTIPEGFGESMFYAVDTIGQHSTLLLHGDQFPSPSSSLQYARKVMGWKTGAIKEPFDDVIVGHYHQSTMFSIGQVRLKIVGSTESDNTFAQERLGTVSRPSQYLRFVDPDRGPTAEYDIFLD